ncbi:MAG: hypothetical protein IPM53_10925 [Anaerolineaceae bacterium]|nr:hypothetical protein [Anaerolineaceae bacterium]
MLDSHTRSVTFHDMILTPSPPNAELITLDVMLTDWITRIKSGGSVYPMNNEMAVMRILDCNHIADRNALALLIQYADGRAADPYFSNMKTGEVRVEPKKEDEGIAASGHILIDLTLVNPTNNSHLCLIEKVPGLSRTNLERLFRHEFKEVADNFPRREDGRTVLGRALVTIDSYMSTSLQELVFGYRLTEVQFISRKVIEGGLDEDPYVQEREHRARYRLGRNWDPDKIWSRARDWFDEARREKVDKVRIRYRDNADKIQSSEVEFSDDSADTFSFSKTSKITVNRPISQCEERLRHDIIAQMFQSLDEVKSP